VQLELPILPGRDDSHSRRLVHQPADPLHRASGRSPISRVRVSFYRRPQLPDMRHDAIAPRNVTRRVRRVDTVSLVWAGSVHRDAPVSGGFQRGGNQRKTIDHIGCQKNQEPGCCGVRHRSRRILGSPLGRGICGVTGKGTIRHKMPPKTY
jgi:hypothetical protein